MLACGWDLLRSFRRNGSKQSNSGMRRRRECSAAVPFNVIIVAAGGRGCVSSAIKGYMNRGIVAIIKKYYELIREVGQRRDGSFKARGQGDY